MRAFQVRERTRDARPTNVGSVIEVPENPSQFPAVMPTRSNAREHDQMPVTYSQQQVNAMLAALPTF